MPLSFQILLIDDDEDDELLIKAAWESVYPVCNLTWVGSENQMQQLISEQRYYPDLIFLSWHVNQPYGSDQLTTLKSSPVYRRIPVVVITSLPFKQAIREIYQTGANSVIGKPENFQEWVNIARVVGGYWLNESVKLTTRSNTRR